MINIKQFILLILIISPTVLAANQSELDAAASEAYMANDYTTAFKDWSVAAAHGDAKAQYELGELYEMGSGTPQNYALAIHWFFKAAEQGNADALDSLSRVYKQGQGVEKNYVESYKWCILALSVGSIDTLCYMNIPNVTKKQVNLAQREASIWYEHHYNNFTNNIIRNHASDLEKLLSSAESGNAKSQYLLGWKYRFGGIGVVQNTPSAMAWLTKAAKQGNTKAEWILAFMYIDGYGVSKNIAKAEYWLMKDAEQDDNDATSLGDMYRKGDHIPLNYIQAARWYTKAAQNGNAGGELGLGLLYIWGYGVHKDAAKGASWIIKAASQGLPEAQRYLGFLYEQGMGVTQNYSEAVKWLTKAAQKNDAPSEVELGQLYSNGEGVHQNYETAYKWYLNATYVGNVKAEFLLGKLYEDGKVNSNLPSTVIPKSEYFRMALKLYAAVINSDENNQLTTGEDKSEFKVFQEKAEYAAGNLYYHGYGVQQSYYAAYKYWLPAAQEGNTEAQLALGKLYTQDKFIFRNNAKSVYWYRKAAGQGNIEAASLLSQAYENGQGVSRNYLEAYKWCIISKASSNSILTYCDASKLTSKQINHAQQEATDWYDQYQNKSNTEVPATTSRFPLPQTDVNAHSIQPTNYSNVDYYLKRVLGPNGHIDKTLHDQFWQQFNGESEQDVSLEINWIKGSLLATQEYEKELWKSALLSYDNHQVIKTERLIQLEKDVPEMAKKSLPWPPGSVQYNEDLAGFNSGWNTSIEDAKRLLNAAASHNNFISVNGTEVHLDKDGIEQASSSIDASIARFKKLLDKNWNGN